MHFCREGAMKKHNDLDVWKLSMDFATDVYRATGKFPDAEKFGLVSQMRRAAVSIPSNIAEGAARQSQKEFIQFLSIAAGSTSELETQLIIARRIGMGEMNELERLCASLDRIGKMLQGLIRSIKIK
jgi:four helix bundle protein